MSITATEFKTNFGQYLELGGKQEIAITKNGKIIARLVPPSVDKRAILDSLVGILPNDLNPDEARYEYLKEKYERNS